MFGKLRRWARLLAIYDLLGTWASLILADAVRRALPMGQPLIAAESFITPSLLAIVGLIFPATFIALAVYDTRRGTRPVGDIGLLFLAVPTATFVFAGTLYFSFRELSRLLVVYFLAINLCLLAGGRLAVALFLRMLRRQGRPLSRVLLVGTGEAAEAICRAVQARLGGAVEIVGCADDEAIAGPAGLPVLGGMTDVPTLVQTHRIDDVILALPASQYSKAEALAYALLPLPVQVRLVPDFLRLVVVQSSVEALGGVPLIGLREPCIDGANWAIKRLLDVAVALAGLALGWPIMLLIAAAIRLDSPGPALFRQVRVGENGRRFQMLKFRTMVADAEQRIVGALDSQGRPIFKFPDDARVTRMGRFLRKTSLDELPQLVNVLRGEMSLVGPRPELQFIVERYEPWQRQRLAVPPGITGWWQVNGRSKMPMHLNTQFDLYYIRNYSLWLDLKILWRTFGAVLRGEGAF